MKRTRAIWIGIVAYFSSMILGLVVNSIMGFEMNGVSVLPAEMRAVSLVVLFSVGMGVSLRYFHGKHTKPTLLHGLYLGGIIVLIGFCFDILTVGLLYMSGEVPSGFNLWDMYTQMWFWISIAVMLGTTTLVGWHESA